MTRTYLIKADLEIHANLKWHFEREAEVIITTDGVTLDTTAERILRSIYPNRVPTNIEIEDLD